MPGQPSDFWHLLIVNDTSIFMSCTWTMNDLCINLSLIVSLWMLVSKKSSKVRIAFYVVSFQIVRTDWNIFIYTLPILQGGPIHMTAGWSFQIEGKACRKWEDPCANSTKKDKRAQNIPQLRKWKYCVSWN